MPRATNKYPFESKIWEGLAKLAFQLTGKSGEGNGFKAALDKNGCLLLIYSESVFPDFRDQAKEAEATLFYDPFDEPEYQYISWSNVTQKTLERILNIQFTPEDFVSWNGSKIEQFPSIHDVMF